MGTSHMQCRRRSEQHPHLQAARVQPPKPSVEGEGCFETGPGSRPASLWCALKRNKSVAGIRRALLFFFFFAAKSLRWPRYGSCVCQNKPGRVAFGYSNRRRVCAVEFLVAQVDQVRAGRKARALWATCPQPPLRPLERTRNKKSDRLHSRRRTALVSPS